MIPNCHLHLENVSTIGQGMFPWGVVNGTHEADWSAVAYRARELPDRVIPCFGIHPWFVTKDSFASLRVLEQLLIEFPSSGVGEVGLDKTRCSSSPIEIQEDILRAQIRLAVQYNRVLSFHCVHAWGRFLNILNELCPPRFLIHAWHGPVEIVPSLNRLGAYYSMNEESLLIHALGLPQDKIVFETDTSMSTSFSLTSLIPTLTNNACTLWRR